MPGWNWQKIKQMLSNTRRLNFCYLKIIHIFHPHYHPKIIWHIIKNKQKNKYVCFHEIIRLIIMKMEMKMKNRSHRRFNINRPRYIHGLKHSKYIKYWIKQHLIKIWSSIHEIVKQHWGSVKKNPSFIKKSVYLENKHKSSLCQKNN